MVLLRTRLFRSPAKFPQPPRRICAVECQRFVVRVLSELECDIDLSFAHRVVGKAKIVELAVLEHQMVDPLVHRTEAESHGMLPVVAMHEIGRAAGRERVCTYEEISVGAVSLKKKNK